MKKFFAAALATAMVVSMAATSFAVTVDGAVMGSSGVAKPMIESSNKIKDAGARIGYGKVVYLQLKGAGTNEFVESYDDVKGTSIKTKWDLNGSAVEKVEILKKKSSADDKYYYYLAVTTKANTTTKETDVAGEISLRKSGTPNFNLNDSKAIKVGFTLGYDIADDDSVANQTVTDTAKLFNFTNKDSSVLNEIPEADEYELKLPGGNYFTVNTIGQGKIILAADQKYNADVAAKYPAANLDFFNGNGASFNKIGELTIMADEGIFLYALNSDGNLTAVKATYDQ